MKANIKINSVFSLRSFFLAYILFIVTPVSAQQKERVINSQQNDQSLINSQKDEEKKIWIKNNNELYKKMGGTSFEDNAIVKPLSTHTDEYSQSKVRVVEFSPNPAIPSFPKYLNTGNKLIDDENYRVKKDKWIQENQMLYDSMNQLPGQNSNKRIKSSNNQ